jgi:branched-chain amino acid transport system ATP-binding protein
VTGLELSGVSAGYARTDVLRDISLTAHAGECIALLGANGAGKSTLLRVLSGQVRLHRGIRRVDGADASSWRGHQFARHGVRWVGEPRPIFPSLTVLENLSVGGLLNKGNGAAEVDRIMSLLPALRDKQGAKAATLSGGQQQILAIGQALMTKPKYLCLDEPSLGLSMRVFSEIADLVDVLVEAGVGIIWAEQFPDVAMEHCTTVALLSAGRIVRTGPAADISRDEVTAVYLGKSLD